MGTQQFCLKWNNHHSNMLSVFEQLLNNEALVDVTLACEGHSLKAHKVVLSACSPFFQTLFVDNPCKHPIVIMKDMRYVDMKAIIDFIYHGEVNVSQDQLSALLKTAETLKVKGLAEVGNEKQAEKHSDQQDVTTQSNSVQSVPVTGIQQHHRTESPPLHKRKRGRPRRRSGSSQSDTEEPVPTKIKEPDSPEIISDVSRDGLTESTPDVSQRISQTRVPPITSSQSYSLSSQKSHSLYSSVPSHHDSGATVEEPPSITDGDFDVEPTRLMEASLTTDASGVSMYDSQAQSSLTSTSTSLALPSSSVELPHSNSLSQAVVPTSLHSASDSSGSGLGNQNTMEDIKPLVSFEEPPIGVSSHSQDSSSTNAVLPYLDTSGVPAVPGPSSFQPSPQQDYWRNKDKIQDSRGSLQAVYKDIPKAVGISKEKYAMIINNFFVQGKESEKVARELNVSEDTVKSAVSFHLKHNLPKTGIFSKPNKSNFISSNSRTSAGSRSIVLTPEQEEMLVQYKRQNASATLKELQSLVREDRVSFPQITNIGLSTLYYILKRHGMNTSRRRYKFYTTV